MLTIERWHQMALDGACIPMRIPINGVSMAPLIRRNRDMVTIVPLREPPAVGDIVMFSDPRARQRYVLHRLWSVGEGQVQTWGDNCLGPDAPMAPDCLWGRATLIERGGRRIVPDARRGLRWARVWHRVIWLRGKVYGWVRPVWHRVKPWVKRARKNGS